MFKGKKYLHRLSAVLFILFIANAATNSAFAFIPEMDFEEMVQLADIVFVGTADTKIPKIAKNRRVVVTDVVFNQIEMIHQKTAVAGKIGNRIILTYAGGRFNEAYTWVSDMPRIENGQRYLVFAYYDGQAYANPFVGGEQGLLKISADDTNGKYYPLTINGSAISGISKGRFNLTPPVKKISTGFPEQAESRMKVKKAAPPPTPEGWQYRSRNHKDRMPEKIMDVEDIIRHIGKAVKKEPSEKVLEKLSKRTALALSGKNNSADTVKSKKNAYEFSDDGRLIILDPSKVNCPDPGEKTTGEAGVAVSQDSIVTPTGGTTWNDIFISGWHDLPVTMDQMPETYWTHMYDTWAMGTYDMYIDDLFWVRDWDGGFSYLNGWSEFCGFLTDAQHRDVFYGGWGDAIAKTWYSGGGLHLLRNI